MARQITILEQSSDTNSSGTRVISLVFWFAITVANKKVPRPGFISKATSITAAEQASLESGDVKEETADIAFPSSYTTVEMKALINKRYTDRLAAVTAESARRAFFGVTFDSVAGWSA